MKETSKLGNGLHIVWTLAMKDIVDALKNRSSMLNILLVVFMLLLYTWLSQLHLADYQSLVIYDQGESRLTSALEDAPEVRMRRAFSMQEMAYYVGDYAIGVVIPADFDQALDAGGQLELTGYTSWASRSKTAEMESNLEQFFAELLGQPVRVTIDGNVLPPDPKSVGPVRAATVAITFPMIWIAVGTVPYLMIEERENKTIDALLISPASESQIVMGKALSGLFYVVVNTGAALVLNRIFVMNWGLAILAFLCGSVLSIALGLLLGTFVQSSQKLGIASLPITLGLFFPVMLISMEDILADAVSKVMYVIPSVALAKVFWFSFSEGVAPAQILLNLGLVLGCAVLIYAAVVWKLRRSDR